MEGLHVALDFFDSLDDLFLEDFLAMLHFCWTFDSSGGWLLLNVHKVVLESCGVPGARGGTELLDVSAVVVRRLCVFHGPTQLRKHMLIAVDTPIISVSLLL